MVGLLEWEISRIFKSEIVVIFHGFLRSESSLSR
jgi:hypothetical protein